jgi:hypothetical protein
MLRNKFRKFTGGLILLVFLIAVFQFFRQTRDNEFVGSALAAGIKLLLGLAIILWVVYLLDRRMKKREH